MRHRTAALLPCLLLASVSCASLAGLSVATDSGPHDGGADSQRLVLDATRADTETPDVGRREGSAGEDARHDAADGPAPKDGATPTDGPHEAKDDEGGATDASSELHCDAGPPIPDASSTVCPPAEAGSCEPESLPGYIDTWRAPKVVPSACTNAQITQFLDECFGEVPDASSQCTSFTGDPANEACIDCMLTNASDSKLGPLVSFSSIAILNLGGCVALLDPCHLSCAMAIEANTTNCPSAACANCSESSSTSDVNACFQSSRACSCLGEATRAGECTSIISNAAASQCYPNDTNGGFYGRATFMSQLFCGAPGDAGAN